MHYTEAQKTLATSIKSVAGNVNSYFWRLSGDEPNSLCKLLSIQEEELTVILQLCQIYRGQNNNFNKTKFEEFMLMLAPCRWTKVRIKKSNEHFILIGDHGTECDLPRMLYNGEGELLSPPVPDVHFGTLRTKLQKGSIPRLLDLGQDANKKDEDVDLKKQSDNNKPAAKNISPRDELLDHVKKLVIDSGGKISERAERHLKSLFARCIDAAAKGATM